MDERLASRRQVLKTSAALLAGTCAGTAFGQVAGELTSTRPATDPAVTQPVWDGPIIDIHQHTTYHGRSDAALFNHQRKMGVTQTILLPSGSPVDAPSTLKGKANGLYAGAGPVSTVVPIAKAHPGEYFFFSNEVPDLPDARAKLIEGLKGGGIGIGEQKFNVPCDSKEMEAIYELAQEYRVPVLMHFQHDMFNTGYERFGKVLEKWSKVTFIGHAVLFWAHIDANAVPGVAYPKGKVAAGGLTDKYLSDYPNLYADMSAGSGLNALIRDEDHARAFIDRHQDRMMFGSDCPDAAGTGPTCTGSSTIAAIQRLSPSKAVARKLLYENARALFKV
jgi:predicted TIM-barrel fold metal-dependent hydrolase